MAKQRKVVGFARNRSNQQSSESAVVRALKKYDLDPNSLANIAVQIYQGRYVQNTDTLFSGYQFASREIAFNELLEPSCSSPDFILQEIARTGKFDTKDFGHEGVTISLTGDPLFSQIAMFGLNPCLVVRLLYYKRRDGTYKYQLDDSLYEAIKHIQEDTAYNIEEFEKFAGIIYSLLLSGIFEDDDYLSISIRDPRFPTGRQELPIDGNASQDKKKVPALPQLLIYNSPPADEWKGHAFRSKQEVRIAQALDDCGILFFPNAGCRITEGDTRKTREADFLIVIDGHIGILECDGKAYHQTAAEDHQRDRHFQRQGIQFIQRYSYEECLNAEKVVKDFLDLMKAHFRI